ncbi:MAG: phosphatidylinositol-4- kinase [Pycnora praestabilis]|nr:MAG: phosphatidylinositol-4- kinase [Pycnora praestabilis]
MECAPRHIRRFTLQKIALLSVASPVADTEKSDLARLFKACASGKEPDNGLSNGYSSSEPRTSGLPMSLHELEALLALCKAAPLLQSFESAEKLLHHLSPHMFKAHTQVFSPSPFLRDVEPSPWEALSYHLTYAVLSIGTNHPFLREGVLGRVEIYLEKFKQFADSIPTSKHHGAALSEADDYDSTLEIATVTISLLGFLDAAAISANFWTTKQRLHLIEYLQNVLSENFLVSVETVFSRIRNSQGSSRALKRWKRCNRQYAASGRPLGAMLLQQGFMRLLVSCTSLLVASPDELRQRDIFSILMSGQGGSRSQRTDVDSMYMVNTLADIAAAEIGLLEDGSDYLQLGSAWQQRLAFAVKGCALTSFLVCTILNDDVADPDTLLTWLEDTMTDPVQMADETLASVVLNCMALVARISPTTASNLSRSLPRFIVRGGPKGRTVTVAAQCLAFVLQLLSQDAVNSTLYTLGNVLSSGSSAERGTNGSTVPEGNTKLHQNAAPFTHQTTGSAISLALSSEEDTSIVYGNVVQAIIGVSNGCHDEKITALAQSMLIQKIGKVSLAVDARIITEAAAVAVNGQEPEFKSMLKLFSKLSHDGGVQNNVLILNAVLTARNTLSRTIPKDSKLYATYLAHLLETIISKGDVHESVNTHQADVELAAQEIAQLLQPLALLLSSSSSSEAEATDLEIRPLYREAWFNLIVHGFSLTSNLGMEYHNELAVLAKHSRSLIAEDRADQLESDVELNTVLRRGMNSQHTTDQKRHLITLLPRRESEIRTLSYPKIIFLSAAYLVECLRANSGDCTKVLTYFLDPGLKTGEMGSCMVSIAEEVVGLYLSKSLDGRHPQFSAPYVAEQLAGIFTGCCHRIERVQQVAASCAERIITELPSALCQKSSLFALLELLSIMWSSCLEAETDEYEWRSTFTSTRGKITVELSDNYALRETTLNSFYRRARGWVMRVMSIAPLDVKGLLQTYLSEYDDDGAYGHVALGRSFALEMGSAIPITDQKLGAIDRHGDYTLNTASDFIAQYTTRQEYRYAEALPDHGREWLNFMHLGNRRESSNSESLNDLEDAETVLLHLQNRTLNGRYVSIGEIRDVLRRAAALLCRTKKDLGALVQHLVGIPFAVFTKHTIKLGISLWLGVINENPRTEPRILAEIAKNWENTVHNKLGIFNDRFHHLDPFYIKEEFAPSDKEALLKRQYAAHNLIAPHLRLLQFLSSHFNATRQGSPHTQKIFHRLIQITLKGLKYTTGHPLTREVHFQVVLFGLELLRHSTGLTAATQWRLKDQILSAALSWFAQAPRWSFGSNRLQIKSEANLLGDIERALQNVTVIGTKGTRSYMSLQLKQDLLLLMLENEHTRLMVWLFPLDHDRKHHFHSSRLGRNPAEATLSAVLKAAWNENPAIAVQLPTRFQGPKIANDVRRLLLNFPEKAIGDPNALNLLLGSSLPNDVFFQLKYLLYWSPVNPITAVTYFLPAYCNHPFVLQYAMRALESHSIDVTFFYVPQIVQTLRYDALGYVERYILETARFSQLFAHQIIWNIKANAYKDENSHIPDPIKPTLDRVMDRLIASFSTTDKAFYEREFSFFNEVTDISGKLRPFIKKSKPEKKQKIEEELRKIQVEVGVYLPSNPDGVVIGIDRKSGKPLQSHAKAPYMATFRIKKEKGDMESTDELLAQTNETGSTPPRSNVVEVWQSAIFKVGDDCRQDVLALQMIAAFRGIFNNVGLDVYVYPYRVTATAPGCGVIDVLPNSISRDMLGREAVNGLYDYFTSKYGSEDSVKFQEVRSNFVKSMAAYSVISYLLQFKDRHNGNIMVDDAGHILHIDFGFCFDIAPGGVRFERAPFKLTSEMVAVMGGSTESQAYRWFEELCIKAFLASRQYTEKLMHVVILMLDSGLPCFKPETIQHFRERFVLERTEREAADFMRDLIKKSHSSYSTKGYDQFQLLTNGIPY